MNTTKRPDISMPNIQTQQTDTGPAEGFGKTDISNTDESYILSSDSSELDLKYLQISLRGAMREAFFRNGPFDFSVHLYPDEVDANSLDFMKSGLNTTSKVYVSTDSLGRTTKYLGEWNGDMREGRGIQVTFNNGINEDLSLSEHAFIYQGFWVDNLAHGKGRLIHHDGDSYEGSWEQGKASGYGEYRHSDGTTFKGNWKEDLQEGFGEEQWVDGSIYKGEYKNGCKHGKGIFCWSDSSVYEGEFNMNSINGYGIYKWPDGRVYKGPWRNNKMEGEGIYTWPDGRVYKGFWHQSQQHGVGTYSEASGEEVVVLYKFGERVK
ncbi:unnamed protein product [Moneuplotes crassus]|uniref:Uncharacterized protein n=1 Tax=Euplotes crassus TaxID=5936 RepID=A0AAD1XK80_EUPCR|nr:unnamed protein product [Moneuplotes crassus]